MGKRILKRKTLYIYLGFIFGHRLTFTQQDIQNNDAADFKGKKINLFTEYKCILVQYNCI